MGGLVIKKWAVDNKPLDQEGNYIHISGRDSGLISWFLALVRVDATTTIKVSMKRVEFKASSLAGTTHRMIPIQGICSMYYGYHKPWRAALIIFVAVLGIYTASFEPFRHASWGSYVRLFWGIAVSVLLPVIYYFLNRTLTLGFIENSGVTSGITFKRSVIENIDVNEKQARFVCNLTQEIVDRVKSQV